jgi:hypothetical protein
MPTTYYLSSRQKKDLLIRGRPILIALPRPPQLNGPAIDWAKIAIEPDIRELVVSAEPNILRVSPVGRREGDLTALIGQLAHGDWWSVGVEAILVSISPRRPRGPSLATQWPAYCVHNGVRIPSPTEAAP